MVKLVIKWNSDGSGALGSAPDSAVYSVLLVSGGKHRRCERPKTGVLTPGTGVSTNHKPWKGDRTSNRLLNSILRILSPLRDFFLSCTTTGGLRPRLCSVVSSRLLVSPLNCLSSGNPNNRRISRGALDFPQITIIAINILLRNCLVCFLFDFMRASKTRFKRLRAWFWSFFQRNALKSNVR